MDKNTAMTVVQFPQTNYYSDCYNFLRVYKTHYKFTSEDLKKLMQLQVIHNQMNLESETQ